MGTVPKNGYQEKCHPPLATFRLPAWMTTIAVAMTTRKSLSWATRMTRNLFPKKKRNRRRTKNWRSKMTMMNPQWTNWRTMSIFWKWTIPRMMMMRWGLTASLKSYPLPLIFQKSCFPRTCVVRSTVIRKRRVCTMAAAATMTVTTRILRASHSTMTTFTAPEPERQGIQWTNPLPQVLASNWWTCPTVISLTIRPRKGEKGGKRKATIQKRMTRTTQVVMMKR
mmetsp:Transcript_22464/g.48905  ORF Transcript_22464/g.48905 Transcript_22464/m.48905 type:complete len:224 (+) Transcript_22464:317-988(+)